MAETKSKPKPHTVLPYIPHLLPTSWGSSDQLPAKLLGFKTIGEYADTIRGINEDYCRDGKRYVDVLAKFIENWNNHHKTQVQAPQFVEIVRRHAMNPKVEPLITDHPDKLVTKEELTALGLPQFIDAAELHKAVVQINVIKAVYWIIIHLHRHLNRQGSLLGHQEADWMAGFLIGHRIRTTVRKPAIKGFQGWLNVNIHNRTDAPFYKLDPIPEGLDPDTAADTPNADEDDDSPTLVHPNLPDVPDDSDLDTDDVDPQQYEVVEGWFQSIIDIAAMPVTDLTGKPIRQRDALTRKQRDRVISDCMNEIEILADGNHARLTQMPLSVSLSHPHSSNHPFG